MAVTVLLTLDRFCRHLNSPQLLGIALAGVLLIGVIDHVTGFELSVSEFYLLPIALAAWYKGRLASIVIAAVSCVTWYVADYAAGMEHSHSAIAAWNFIVRLGFFIAGGLLFTGLQQILAMERQLARIDSLTGLYGRRVFGERLEQVLQRAQRHRTATTIAYVDLDDFKNINDTLGHAEGDRALRVTGQVLKNSLRKSDTAARLGGDEFALILGETDRAGARQVISKVAANLRKAFAANRWNLDCSIGVVTILDAARAPADAVAAADALMYRVKRKGKGTVQFGALGEGPDRRAAAAPQAARA